MNMKKFILILKLMKYIRVPLKLAVLKCINIHLSPRCPAVKGEGLAPGDGHHGVVQVGGLEDSLS